MPNEKLDTENIVVIGIVLLMFFWFNKNKTAMGVGSGAGNPTAIGKGGGCGCHSMEGAAAPAQAPSTTQGTQSPVLPTSTLWGPRPVLAGGFAPGVAPGSNSRGAGSGGNWSSLNSTTGSGTTPRNAPGAPTGPGSSGVFVRTHATPTRHKA
jgi:hypothetical protein